MSGTQVIVGGGPAGASAARVLAESGPAARVVVVSAEPIPPYDRTTLSKAMLVTPGFAPPPLWLPGEAWLARVEVRTGQRVTDLHLAARTVRTDAGELIAYDALLLATGARPRRLDLPGVTGPGVHYLRDVADAEALHDDLRRTRRLVVIGGGVIGLEVAAAARTLGVAVEVVEAGPRLLGRAVPEQVAAWLAALHRDRGAGIRTAVAPSEILRRGDRVTGVRLSEGTVLDADTVVIGVGVVPRDRLARAAGLAVDDGILVDRACRTSDPQVFAAGDVARMRGPAGGRGTRLESYQPAGRHGEIAARAMLGGPETYADVPWFWSDHYDATLQSAGLAPPGAEQVCCGDADAVLVLSFLGGALVAACGAGHGHAVARPVRAAQRVMAAAAAVDRAALAAASSDLAAVTRLLLAAARAAG